MTPIQIAQFNYRQLFFFSIARSLDRTPLSFLFFSSVVLFFVENSLFNLFFPFPLFPKNFRFFSLLKASPLLSFFSLSKEKTRKSVEKRLRRAFLSALSAALFQRGDALALDCSRAFVSRSLLRRAFVVNDG